MDQNNQLIARILLHPDGSLHIALNNFHTYFANTIAIQELLSDPYEFLEEGYKRYHDSTRETEAQRDGSFRGLTLLNITADKCITCFFPELFQTLFSAMKEEGSDKLLLTMTEYLNCKEFEDEKSYFLKFFMEYGDVVGTDLVLKRSIPLSQETRINVLQETISSFWTERSKMKERPAVEQPDLADKIDTAKKENTKLPKRAFGAKLVTIEEYAVIYNKGTQCIKKRLKENRFTTAVLASDGKTWLLDPDEKMDDRRKGRKSTKKNAVTVNTSYEDLQRVIRHRKYCTDAIAKYIRTSEEMKYYFVKHFYHEIYWADIDVHALIIDISPDYISPLFGKSNREIILKDNGSPVIPNREGADPENTPRFDLHHIGQMYKSPFAIIPSTDHNSEKYSSVFHDRGSGEKVHDAAFKVKKMMFWKRYLEAYDAADGVFGDIPYLNHKKDRVKGYPKD